MSPRGKSPRGMSPRGVSMRGVSARAISFTPMPTPAPPPIGIRSVPPITSPIEPVVVTTVVSSRTSMF
ncbi:MAG: hypothetical protein BYD32DRAFT_425468 [Podila humilis]|nr:MAG: hypothetical protein BYD32DRAFT_425468 [Podila humilis]